MFNKVACFLFFALAPFVLTAETPAERSGKIGIYDWIRPSGTDPVGQVMADVQTLGYRQPREVVSPGPWWDPIGDASDLSPFDQKIQRADYALKFATYKVVNLTVFEVASYDPTANRLALYANPAEITPAYLQAVQSEFRNGCYVATQLSAQYSVLIRVGNWEAANAFQSDASWKSAQDGTPALALQYYQARINGCVSGRAKAIADGFPGKLEIFFEYTLNQPGLTDGAGNVRQVSDMLEGLKNLQGVDLWSYSSWMSVLYGDDPEGTAAANAASYRDAIDKFKGACSALVVTSCRFMIGEVGYLNNRPENPMVLQAIVNTALDEGAEAVISWILYDDPTEGEWGLFGSFDTAHNLTPQGEMFRQLLLPAVPSRVTSRR